MDICGLIYGVRSWKQRGRGGDGGREERERERNETRRGQTTGEWSCWAERKGKSREKIKSKGECDTFP